jgi:2,4-dienoyl-CoA reductase-like NADH-dependent reductase (Old Yellow Enzyme family)
VLSIAIPSLRRSPTDCSDNYHAVPLGVNDDPVNMASILSANRYLTQMELTSLKLCSLDCIHKRSSPMPHLFEPFSIRSLTLPHRIIVSPMCQYSSADGFANDWHLVHLGSRAVGRAAIVFTEANAVVPEGRISPQDLGIWKDEHIDFLARITGFIKSQGSIPATQLAHAGRKASTDVPWKGGKPLIPEQGGWSPIFAPSSIPFADGYQVPKELSSIQIRAIINAFRNAARRSLSAGFEIIELHAAHGYLLHEFLSPLSNHRTDEYGGSFDNRIRLLCQVAAAVREVWPEHLPLFTRISATDWVEGGWDIEQSIELSRRLKSVGVDLIDCSSGGNVAGVKIPTGPGYQTKFAERIRREAEILTCAVGLITAPQQADHIIRSGQADFVMLAREFLRHPYWPLRAAKELNSSLQWPVQYERANN